MGYRSILELLKGKRASTRNLDEVDFTSDFRSKVRFPRLTLFFSSHAFPLTILKLTILKYLIKLIPFGGAKLERKLDCSMVDKAPRSRTHQT